MRRFEYRRSLAAALALALTLPAGAAAQEAQQAQGRGLGSGQGQAAGRGQGTTAQSGRRISNYDELGIHGFSVVLVIGDMQAAAAGSDTVPGAARKALADMKDFLPYKSYRLLDAGWVLCCGPGFGSASGRVRADDQEYSYQLSTMGVNDSKITVHFGLREEVPGAFTSTPEAARDDNARADSVARAEQSRQKVAETERELARVKALVEKGVLSPTDLRAAQQAYESAARAADSEMIRAGRGRSVVPSRSIMDSSFSIAVNETVVIGTSRLKGDKALIALLTAAGKPGSTSR